MCGFYGVFPAKNLSEEKQNLDLLEHRGPDSKNFRCINNLFLGHTRLSILDLSEHGTQPMKSSQADVWLVFNGEIYNYKQLKQELSGDYSFFSDTDSEVILAAYLKWGERFLEKINGMFAIALYDQRENLLLLARDRIGKKPLYYSIDSTGTFRFSSEFRVLNKYNNELDTQGLNQYFSRGFIGGSITVKKNIYKLPKAGYCVIKLQSPVNIPEPKCYWKIPHGESKKLPIEDATEKLDQLLNLSIKDRLWSDVPLGVFLSGGLDSSLITAIAANNYPSIEAYTISFPNESCDEACYARKVADHLGIKQHILDVDSTSFNQIPNLIAKVDEPFADSSWIPTYLVSQQAAENLKVILSGDGGDELFAGYSHYDHFAIEEKIRKAVPAPIRRKLAGVFRILPERHSTRTLKRLRYDCQYRSLGAYYESFFNEAERSNLLSPELVSGYPLKNFMEIMIKTNNWQNDVCLADFQSYMVDDILVKVDRASMLNSLEVRSPLLDFRIAEFAFSEVDVSLKRHHGEKKYLLKQIAKKYLPSDYNYNRKQGFGVPLGSWFKGQLGELLQELVHDSKSNNMHILNYDYVLQLLNKHQRGFSNFSKKLYAILVWELWVRKNNETITSTTAC